MPASTADAVIINRVARTFLQPLGLQRSGRSRLWYDDHGWRVFFVEFQPSSWSKGTYCNVGTMWLWDPDPKRVWAFHVSKRIRTSKGDFASFDRDPSQFEDLVTSLAGSAADAVARMRAQFSTLASVTSYYAAAALVGWPGYYCGIAHGLMGHRTEAERRLLAVASDAEGSDIGWIVTLGSRARALASLAHDVVAFRDVIHSDVARKREALRLPPIEEHLPSR